MMFMMSDHEKKRKPCPAKLQDGALYPILGRHGTSRVDLPVRESFVRIAQCACFSAEAASLDARNMLRMVP
jgi:hypothetical protein